MKAAYLLFALVFALAGCSSSTLLEAIEKTGRESVEVLIQDDNDEIVVFLSEDYEGHSKISLDDFSLENGRYEYDTNGEFAKNVDLTEKNEFVKVSRVGVSSNAVIWGSVFNYPDVAKMSYTLLDDKENVLYESNVDVNEQNIMLQKLPNGIYEEVEYIQYQILDEEENIIIEG